MAIKQKDRNVLDFVSNKDVLEELDPVFSAPPELTYEEQNKQQERVFSEEEEQMFQEVEDALAASSGVRKLLKSLYSEGASVAIDEEETALLDAVERLYGYRSNQITFRMYEQALEILTEQSMQVYKEVL